MAKKIYKRRYDTADLAKVTEYLKRVGVLEFLVETRRDDRDEPFTHLVFPISLSDAIVMASKYYHSNFNGRNIVDLVVNTNQEGYVAIYHIEKTKEGIPYYILRK